MKESVIATRPRSRRQWLATLAGAAAGVQVTDGQTQPGCGSSRGIRWIVPNSPGGGYDAYSRLLQPFLERELGVGIQIDNQPGVGGLRGARLIAESTPDGETLGIVNAPALLMTQFTGDLAFDPIAGFTSLGMMAKGSYVWATSASSQIRSVNDMMEVARSSSLVFGVTTLRDLSFLVPAMTTSMLGWNARFVSGYQSSADRAMAVIRGEVDLVALSWELLVDRVEAGDLRPVLAMSPDVTELDPTFESLPSITGANGLMSRVSPAFSDTAESLVRLMEAGRVIVAPPKLPPDSEACLGRMVCRVLQDPALRTAGSSRGLAVQPLCAAETTERLQIAKDDVARLAPLVRTAIERAR